MLGCGIKQTNHSRYSAPPAPQHTWTGEGMSPKGLGWKQESRCQLAFQTLNDMDKEAWGGGSGDTWHSRRFCQECAEQFSTSVSTVKPRHPNRLLSHPRPKSTSRPSAPVLRSSATAAIVKKSSHSLLSSSCLSQPIFHHCRLDLFGFQMASDVENAPSPELWGAECRQMQWLKKKDRKGVQKAAICASQTSGASPSFSSRPFNTE